MPIPPQPKRPDAFWAFLSYLAGTVLLTRPLPWKMGSVIASDAGDPILNAWVLWWSTMAVPLTDRWWDAGIFYPIENAFTFSENLLGVLPISAPVQWLSGNPVLAYNAAFFLSFPLSALAAYLLCFDLSGRRDAAWIAGIAYGFCPYRIDQLPHIQVLSSYWLVIALLALHRYLREGRARWLLLFGAMFALQGLTNLYYLLYFPVLVALWALWFVRPIRQWRTLAAIAAAGAIAATLLLPLLLRYRDAHDSLGLIRSMGEIQFFSADLSAVVAPPARLSLWGSFGRFRAPEGALFPGLTLVCLVVAGALKGRWPRETDRPRWRRLLHGSFRALTVAALLALALRLAVGPWRIEIFGITLLSVARYDKTLSIIMMTGLVWLWNSPAVVAARARRSALPFYAGAALVIFVLTLGPSATLLDEPILAYSPYRWLLRLPGFDGLRVPTRFWMLAAICLATAGGLAFRRLVPARGRARWAVAVLVGGAIFAEGFIPALPTARLPERSRLLERHAENPVIELPLTEAGRGNLEAMYRAMFHRQPVANGYSGYFAPHYTLLEECLGTFQPDALPQLAALGIRDVLVRGARDPEGRVRAFVEGSDGVTRIAADAADTLYRLPAAEGEPRTSFGPPLPIRVVTANVNEDQVPLALDGDLTTRWSTGPQRRGHRLVIDLGTPRAVGAVVLNQGPFTRDFPRLLSIELSPDGQTWERVFRGPTACRGLPASIRSPLDGPLEFALDGRSARFVRLRQRKNERVYYWSIAELRVLAASDEGLR